MQNFIVARRLVCCWAVLGLLSISGACSPASEKVTAPELVKIRTLFSTDKLSTTQPTEFVVLATIEPKWHINANPAHPDYLIPTTVTVKSKTGVTVAAVSFPAGIDLRMEGESEPVKVYEGEVRFRGTFTVPAAAAGKPDELEVVVQYQACNDKTCLPPKKVSTTHAIEVVPAGQSVQAINREYFPSESR